MSDDSSGIHYSEGATTIYGPDGIAFYRATVVASGLKMYAEYHMQPSRVWTPKAMMAAAEQITGKKFRPRAYLEAAEAVRLWAVTMKAALPITTERDNNGNDRS
jgi:hypothetical protein